MPRHNRHVNPARVALWSAWTATVLTVAAGPMRSAAVDPEATAPAIADRYGDPLPTGARARLGTTRWRHGTNITFVFFGVEGKTLVTAADDNIVRLWDLTTGQKIRRFAPPRSATTMPQATGPTPAAVQRLGTMARVAGSLSVSLAPDGKTLAVTRGSAAHLYDVETGKELRKIDGPPTGLIGLLFSPDGQTLAARGGDGAVIVWEAATGKEVHHIKGPAQPDNRTRQLLLARRRGGDTPGMAYAPDGKTLAFTVAEFKEQTVASSVRIYDLGTGNEKTHIKGPEGMGLSAVAFSPKEKILAYGAANVPTNAVYLCDPETGKELRQIQVPDGVVSLVFSPDGKALAVRGLTQQTRLWDTATGKELYRLGDLSPTAARGGVVFAPTVQAPETRTVAFSPDGTRIATASGGSVRLWDRATGKELPLADSHHAPLAALAIWADGKTAVSWGADQMIRRWEAATGKALGSFPAPPGTTLAVFSPDGRTVALANAGNSIQLADTATGRRVHRISGPPAGTAALAFAPDGKVLAARGGDNAIRLYDVMAGSELRLLNAQAASNPAARGVVAVDAPVRGMSNAPAGLVFSPDGKLLASPGPSSVIPGTRTARNTIDLFDVSTGKLIRKLEASQPVVSFAFSPDNRILAAEHADQSLRLWEVASGKERAQLGKAEADPRTNPATAGLVLAARRRFGYAEPAGPTTLAFSPDGRGLATRGPGNSVRVWNVAESKAVAQLTGHEGRVETISISPDGSTIASGSADTTILLWNTATFPRPELVDLSEDAVEHLWRDLGANDAAQAGQSVLKLAGDPKQAVPFLAERLQPAVAVDPQKVARWLADMENDKYAVRREAVANLLKTGEQVAPALQEVLASQPTIETRKRVEELLDKLTGGTLSAEQLQMVRSVEVLERMGTTDAKQLLRALAQGARGALPTLQAQAALDRLN